MVACETGEENCVNGGWVHPQCSNVLRNLTDNQIDEIDIFFCEDCTKAKNQMEQQLDDQDGYDITAIELDQEEQSKLENTRKMNQKLDHFISIQSKRPSTGGESLIVSIDNKKIVKEVPMEHSEDEE